MVDKCLKMSVIYSSNFSHPFIAADQDGPRQSSFKGTHARHQGHQFIYLSIYLSIYPSFYLFICLYIFLLFSY